MAESDEPMDVGDSAAATGPEEMNVDTGKQPLQGHHNPSATFQGLFDNTNVNGHQQTSSTTANTTGPLPDNTESTQYVHGPSGTSQGQGLDNRPPSSSTRSMDLPKGTKGSTINTPSQLKQQDFQDNNDETLYLSDDGEGVTRPSAPLDIATVNVRVEWPENKLPQRWDKPPSSSTRSMDLPKGTKGSTIDTSSLKLKQHDSQDNNDEDMYLSDDGEGVTRPSAPLDIATVNVRVEWPEKTVPQRWDKWLTKVLQTWFNKDTVLKGCTVHKLEPLDIPYCAKVKITAAALRVLLDRKTTRLPPKDGHTAIVHFSPSSVTSTQSPSSGVGQMDTPPLKINIPMMVTAKVDLQRFSPQVPADLMKKYKTACMSGQTISMTGSFEEIDTFYKEICKAAGWAESGPGAAAINRVPNTMETSGDHGLKVPLLKYWYLNQAYRKEMDQIEKKHGVSISADVSVSIVPKQGTSVDSLLKANQEFTDLFCECCENGCVDIPHTHLESDIVKETLKNIQTEEAKMVLSMSADGCRLFAPEECTSRVQRRLGVDTSMEDTEPRWISQGMSRNMETNTRATGSEWKFQETFRNMEMDIRDPLLSGGLPMNHTHWKLMKLAFVKQMSEIEIKFGVAFVEEQSKDEVRVRAQSAGGQHVCLKTHALRALMHLYQEVAMTMMRCAPKDPTQVETVGRTLDAIHSAHLCIGAGEKYGPWSLIGLPEHLGPVVAEIEKKLGGPVFDEKQKELIVYLGDSSFKAHGNSSGLTAGEGTTWGGGGAGSKSWEREGSGLGNRAWGGGEGSGGRSREETKGNAGGAAERGGGAAAEEDKCSICIDNFVDKKKLPCGHEFCNECLRNAEESLGAICSVCKTVYGKMEGNQPKGTMMTKIRKDCLPGFTDCGTIVIDYIIPGGMQSSKHPNPGKFYYGTQRTAYLPNNPEGNQVLGLLKRAFEQKLIFTVGTSRTTGNDDCVTWNDIHHKTTTSGGTSNFGYPDPDYLKRVKDELKAKGVE